MSDQVDKFRVSNEFKHSLRMKIALEVSKTGTFLWDIQKDKLEWDDGLLALFEVPPSNKIKTLADFLEHILPEDQEKVKSHITNVLKDGTGCHELRVQTSSGEIKWFRDSAKALYDESGEPYAMVGACTEITDLKNKIEQCRLAQEQAEKFSASKTEFIANISHDMRTPLTAVLGFAEVLRSSIQSDTELGYLEIIERNAGSLLKLIDSVLDISRIEAGEDREIIEPVSLKEMFSNVCKSVSKDLEKRGTVITYEVASEFPEIICIDSQKVRRIIMNLLSNAIRYTPSGIIKIIASHRQSSMRRDLLVVQVADNGEGILDEDKMKIFDPFSSDKMMKMEYKNTGLGLYISRKLAKSLGGSLDLVSSSKDAGSVFELCVPFSIVRSAPLDFNNIKSNNLHQFSGCTALIVEDNIDNQLLIKTKLQSWGFDCVVLENGRETVEELSCKKYDVVFMDIRIPFMDGISVTRFLREKGYTGVIIAMTANAFSQEREQCLAAGCDWYFSKPIDFEKLNSALYEILK